MAYVKKTWQNTPSTNTPVNAANLNHMEQGIYDAAAVADQAKAGVEGLDPRMDLVEQRLDNLIPQGTPTQGNAELIDIRVGANGITYPDAGSAVRGQYTELKSALTDIDIQNVLYRNINVSSDLTFTDDKGVLNSNSTISTTSTTALSGFIHLKQGQSVFVADAYGSTAVCCIAAFWTEENTTAFDKVAYTGSTAENHEYIAKQDCYVAFTVLKTKKSDLIVYAPAVGNVTEVEISQLNDAIYERKKVNPHMTENYYIKTDFAVGSEVSLIPVSNNNYKYEIIDCKKGDIYGVTIEGGAAARPYCVLDSNNLVVEVASANNKYNNQIIRFSTDGKLVLNSKIMESVTIYKYVTKFSQEKETVLLDGIDVSLLGSNGYISCGVSVGTQISMIPENTNSWSFFVHKCNVGDRFKVTGTSGNNSRAFCFIDDDNIVQYVADASVALEDAIITSPINGRAIFNWSQNYDHELIIYQNIDKEDVPSLYSSAPYVLFDYDHDFHTVDTSVVTLYNNPTGNIVSDIQGLFDGLVTNYDFVTSEDIATFTGLSYPAYATTYTTKIYKFSYQNEKFYNVMKKKRTMLLVGGIHGNETLSPFNMYLFAKELCEASDENLFKLLSAYDIYMIPCVNGYGINNGTRTNFNGVDINRNFPVEGWREMASGQYTYTGPSAGSEFETKFVIKSVELTNAEMFIDCHNYSYSTKAQFYSEFTELNNLNLAFQSAVDCSIAFIKNLPSYFGTVMHIFAEGRTSAPTYIEEYGIGKTARYFYEQGLAFSATIEVNDSINYVNGEATTQVLDHGGEDTFAVAEYTLRNQLLRYSEWVMKKID